MKRRLCFTLTAMLLLGSCLSAQTAATFPSGTSTSEKLANGDGPASHAQLSPRDSSTLEPIERPLAYPPEAKERGIEGKVVVKISVSETGVVESAEPVSGDPLLTTAAVEAVRQWRFKPFFRNGKAVRVVTNLPVIFALPEKNDSKLVELAKIVRPVYPARAKQEDIQGQATVRAFLSEEGDVQKVEVVDSTDRIFEAAALEAVRQWKFKPFLVHGKAIPVAVKVPVDFAFSDRVDVESALREKYPREASAALNAPAPQSIGKAMTAGHLVYKVTPIYPWQAMNTHTQGVVILQALISKEGRVESLKLVSGDASLVQSSIGAVKQWRYEPFLLNGEPVAVDTPIEVHFSLGPNH